MPINNIPNIGKWRPWPTLTCSATQKGADGDDKELKKMLNKFNWHQRSVRSNSDGLLQTMAFFKADYLQMLSILGPSCVDSTIYNDYGATEEWKLAGGTEELGDNLPCTILWCTKWCCGRFLQLLQFPLSIFIPLIVPYSSIIVSSMQYHPNELSE